MLRTKRYTASNLVGTDHRYVNKNCMQCSEEKLKSVKENVRVEASLVRMASLKS